MVLLLVVGVIWLMSGSNPPPVAAGPGGTAAPGSPTATPGQPTPTTNPPSGTSPGPTSPPTANPPGDAKPNTAPGTATPGSTDVRSLFSLPQAATTMLIPNVGYCQFVVADGQLYDLKKGTALGKCESSDKYGVKKTVSPDGKYYAYQEQAGNESAVTVVAFPGGAEKHALKFDKDKSAQLGPAVRQTRPPDRRHQRRSEAATSRFGIWQTANR